MNQISTLVERFRRGSLMYQACYGDRGPVRASQVVIVRPLIGPKPLGFWYRTDDAEELRG